MSVKGDSGGECSRQTRLFLQRKSSWIQLKTSKPSDSQSQTVLSPTPQHGANQWPGSGW